MEHEHDALIGNDFIIRCRTCGEILPYAEVEICKVSSALMANRTIQAMAVTGKYMASSFNDDFVIYTRKINGIKEEITGEKIADRQYRVFKRLSTGGDT